MKLQNLGVLLCSFLVILALAGTLLAGDTATFTGRVTDPTEAVMPGVRVEAVNVNTNVTYSTTTNSVGLYVIPNVPPGTYRLFVRKQGFRTIIKPDIIVHVQDQVAQNFTLALGSMAESITVRGGAPLLNSQSPAVSTIVNRKFVENLPLNGRSFSTLIELTPGVVLTRGSVETGQFSVNGQRSTANAFIIDGVSANVGVSALVQPGPLGGSMPAYSASGGTNNLVSIDAMEEFRIQTSTFSAEFGRQPGAQVSIVTRSGTNDFHGTLFNYFRNEKLDGNDWFANAADIPQAALRQNDFGGFLGGPIVRDKTFFFFSYEGLRLRLPQTMITLVPSLALRASAIPAAAPYLNAYPQPNGPVSASGNVAEFIGSWSNQTQLNATSVRIDHAFSSKLTVFGRYNNAPSFLNSRSGVLSHRVRRDTDTTTLTFGATIQLTPQVTNSFRGNYSVQEQNGFQSLDSFGGATPPDLSILLPPPLTPAENQVGIALIETGFVSLGSGLTASQPRASQINLLDDLAVTAGRHQLRFGVDYREHLLSDRAPANIFAYYVFPASTQNFASTGIVDFAYNFATRRPPVKMKLRSVSLYAQDAWKIRQRLTLTYGLRWDSNIAPKGVDGTLVASWTNVDDPPNTALAPPGTPVWKTRYNNFAPRVGIAYQVTSKGDLVIRGGWGLFYDLGLGIVGRLMREFPNRDTLSASGVLLPITDLTPFTPSFSLDPPFPSTVHGFTPDLKLPRSQQWNIAVEKSLGGEQTISATYVGQVGRKLLRLEREVQPNPDFPGQFRITRNGDTSDYHALQLQFRRPLSRGLQALMNYTWSHSIDTNSDDSFNLASNTVIPGEGSRGSSSFDVRHNFSAAFTYELPRVTDQGALNKITRNWLIDAVVQARTALPINVRATAVVIPGVSGSSLRPDLVPGEPFWLQDDSVGGGRRLNPAAFSLPPTPRQGTLGRNVIRGFGFSQIDLSIGRRFGLTEKLNLQFRADMFNVFNHPNFADPLSPSIGGSGLVNDSSAQMLSRGLPALSALYQPGGPRSMQLSLKLTF